MNITKINFVKLIKKQETMTQFYNDFLETMFFEMINATDEELLNSETDKPVHDLIDIAIFYETEHPREIQTISFEMTRSEYYLCNTFNIWEMFRTLETIGEYDEPEVIYFKFDLDETTGLYNSNGNVDDHLNYLELGTYSFEDIKKISEFIKFKNIDFTRGCLEGFHGDTFSYERLSKHVGGLKYNNYYIVLCMVFNG